MRPISPQPGLAWARLLSAGATSLTRSYTVSPTTLALGGGGDNQNTDAAFQRCALLNDLNNLSAGCDALPSLFFYEFILNLANMFLLFGSLAALPKNSKKGMCFWYI